MTNINQLWLKYQLKRTLKQFAVQWFIDAHDFTRKSLRTLDDFLARVHTANWLPEIKNLPEQERLSLLLNAFVKDPPRYWRTKEREPDPLTAFLIGAVCLDTQEAKEELFVLCLHGALNGYWIQYAVKPLGALRTIDLIFETIADTMTLNLLLYDFESRFLSYVALEDREAVKQYYIPLRLEARDKLVPFHSPEKREEGAKDLEAKLESMFRIRS